LIGISKLYLGTVEPSDPLRYGRDSKKLPHHLLQFSRDKKPVVVWNVTKRCNLRCLHCYADAGKGEKEISLKKALSVIDDLSEFGVPVLLFSGGEPLLREDIFELIYYASKKGIRTVLSTNGTLIDRDTALRLKDSGISYVGISLDGIGEVNDRFRGVKGAFEAALKGIENCKKAGIKVGIRFTMNKRNVSEIPKIFSLSEKEGVERLCFYHLVYSGRGSSLIDEDLSLEEKRKTLDYIINRTKELYEKGLKKEVLTVDNHADGPYIYLRMLREGNPRAEDVLRLLKMNGGNSSGERIGCISWDGSVYPDQFWRSHLLGNVCNEPFSKIWTKSPFLEKLRRRERYIKGRCSRCRWFDVCRGNFRARAEAATGDIWASDPACYLKDEEIGL